MIKDFFKKKISKTKKNNFLKLSLENSYNASNTAFNNLSKKEKNNLSNMFYNDFSDLLFEHSQKNKIKGVSINCADDARKLVVGSIFTDATFNINRFLPNYLGKLSSNVDKFLLLYRIGIQTGYFTCLTYFQEQLKMLFDSSLTVRRIIEVPVALSFSNILLNDGIDKAKLLGFKNILQKIIIKTELLGGCVVKKDNNNYIINDKDETIQEEDFNYIDNNADTIPVRSLNCQHGSVCNGVKPFGLSCLEDKIFLLENDNQVMRSLNEIMQRMIVMSLTLPPEPAGIGLFDTKNKIDIDKIQSVIKSLSTVDTMSVLTLLNGMSFDYKSANIDLSMFREMHYNNLMELSGGVPVSFWKAEQEGSINIGDNGNMGITNLQFLKNKYRAHYEAFILKFAKMYFNDNSLNSVNYEDLDTNESAIRFNNYKNIAELLATLSSIGVGEIEGIEDVKNKVLNAIKEKLD